MGADAVVGAFCFIAGGARIGPGCRIQGHTDIWDGVTLEEDVFVGPSATFTNVRHPRAAFSRGPAGGGSWDEIHVGRGAPIGANATLVAPLRIGDYAMIGAGAVVTKDVPAHAVVAGNPARVIGWACVCGETVARGSDRPGTMTCSRCEPPEEDAL